MKNSINIALVGVGGQGTLLASEVISRAAMLDGYDVKKSEIHGMAQRGGSVVSQVRIGEKVYSPIIPEGKTDILVSFDLLESLRYADSVAPEGIAIINKQIITPVTVSSGQQSWIDDIDDRIDKAFPNKKIIPALDIAKELGNIRTVNIVMTGVLSKVSEISPDIWEQAILELVPAKHKNINLDAFNRGRNIG